MKTRQSFVAVVAIFATAHSALSQGALTPPGPPAPTMKSLDQVQPRIPIHTLPGDDNYQHLITQPGSYYLTGNLAVTKPNGIRVGIDGVTIDLNGFQISRPAGSGGNGIEITSSAIRTTVHNGTIKGGFATGIAAAATRSCAFRDLGISSCNTRGLAAGQASVLESIRAWANTGTSAISAGEGSTLTNCTAYENNSTEGAISAGEGSTLTNCTALSNNTQAGIFADRGSTLTNCTASNNTSAAGFSAGFQTEESCVLVNCSAVGNTSAIVSSTSSQGVGFLIDGGSIIRNCTARENKGNGIQTASGTTVRENNCLANGGAGVLVTGVFGDGVSLVEANHVVFNTRGIDIAGPGNVIVKNVALNNTQNYRIVANNKYGAITSPVGGAEVPAGNGAAASTFGSTDPWANMSD